MDIFIKNVKRRVFDRKIIYCLLHTILLEFRCLFELFLAKCLEMMLCDNFQTIYVSYFLSQSQKFFFECVCN